jgi:ubiquinone/menaquinone biosynthesis C-methylase UbiE
MSATDVRTYVLGHDDAEIERLKRQADFYAPLTAQALRFAGIAPGMRVLDAGCGAGDVSLLISRLVGPAGEVIAVDNAPQAIATASDRLDALGVDNVHFIEGDLAVVELEAPVDAIVGRLILQHVPDPVAVLRNLTRSLTCPGVVLFQEFDLAVTRSEPPCPLAERMIELVRQAFARSGVDARPGFRLYDHFREAGLPSPELMSLGRIEAAPAPGSARMLVGVLTTLLPVIEATGVATAAEIDLPTLPERLMTELAVTESLVFPPPLITAWTRVQ